MYINSLPLYYAILPWNETVILYTVQQLRCHSLLSEFIVKDSRSEMSHKCGLKGLKPSHEIYLYHF